MSDKFNASAETIARLERSLAAALARAEAVQKELRETRLKVYTLSAKIIANKGRAMAFVEAFLGSEMTQAETAVTRPSLRRQPPPSVAIRVPLDRDSQAILAIMRREYPQLWQPEEGKPSAEGGR